MKASKDLFVLINSLSKSEKGYFKKFTALHTRGDENQYVKLFDLIEKQEEYDEQKAINTIGLSEQPKNFAVLKSYLYDLVLKSLRSYHSLSSPELEIKELMEYIEILYNKGLYKQCNKIVSKAIALSEKFEMFLPLAELYAMQHELAHLQNYADHDSGQVDAMFDSISRNIKKYQNIIDYKRLLSKLFVEKKSAGFTRNLEELEPQEKLSKNDLLINVSRADSYQALWHYYLWHSIHNFSKHDYEKSYHNAKTLVNHIESHPKQMEFKPKSYITALNNLLVTQIETGRYNEMGEILKKIKIVVPKTESIKRWLFYVINGCELNLFMNTGEFEKGLKLVVEIEKQLNEQENFIPHQENEIILIFNIALTYFGGKNYSKANSYLNKIIHESSLNMRTDVHCFARIMSLIVHSEMGNTDMLEYTIKSTYRFLYKRNKLYKFENLILRFMKKNMSSKAINEIELHDGFKTLRAEINELKKDFFEKKALHYFDFESWLTCKIEKRPFAEVVEEKAKRLFKEKTLHSK